MARPQKDNAEYFAHDKGMRDNRRIKAVRQKFGLEGYAVWCMLIESLTDADGFRMEWNDLTLELLAGDFGIDAAVLQQILDCFSRLKLIELTSTELYSPGLLERMEPLRRDRERKREWAREKAKPQDVDKQADKEFSTSKTPQSKVKESKVKESKDKEEIDDDVDARARAEEILKKIGTPAAEANTAPVKDGEGSDQLQGAAAIQRYADQLRGNADEMRLVSDNTRTPLSELDAYLEAFAQKKRIAEAVYTDFGDFKRNFLYWIPTEQARRRKAREQPGAAPSPKHIDSSQFEALNNGKSGRIFRPA